MPDDLNDEEGLVAVPSLRPPAVPILSIPAYTPEYVDADSNDSELDKADAEIAHLTLTALMQGWDHVHDIQDLCKMVDTSFKAITMRRTLLGKTKVIGKTGSTFLGALE